MRDIIIKLLLSTERTGMESMVTYLTDSGFFESPASMRYHGVYVGGLAEHSFNVYQRLLCFDKELKLETPTDAMIVAGLLHDVCKIGAYRRVMQTNKWSWNRQQPKGHALLSLKRILEHIALSDLEEKMIQFHMGLYGLVEFDPKKGEYPLRGGALANAWHHYPIVKVIYFCDEICNLAEMAKERP